MGRPSTVAPDPYNCDVIFSISLLLTFCTMLPAVLSVGMVDWVVSKRDPLTNNSQNEVEFGNVSARLNIPAEIEEKKVEVTRHNGMAEKSPRNLTLNATSWKPGSNNTVQRNLNQLRRIDDTPGNTSAGKHENFWLLEWTVLVANFKFLCIINVTERNCQLLGAFSNDSLVPPSCLQANETHEFFSLSPTDTLKCSAFRLSRAMLATPGFLSVLPVAAAIFTVTAAVIIDIIAVFGNEGPGSKILLGILLAAAGAVQITSVVFLYRDVVLTLGVPEFAMGIPGYFSAVNGGLCLVASTLLIASSRKKRRSLPSPVTESKMDIPYKKKPTDSEKEPQTRHLSSNGFFEGDNDVEGEVEWSYSPLVVDAKEVRFEFCASPDRSEDGVYPEFVMFGNGVKILECPNGGDQPSASNAQAANSQMELKEEELFLISPSDKNNAIDRSNSGLSIEEGASRFEVSEAHVLTEQNRDFSEDCPSALRNDESRSKNVTVDASQDKVKRHRGQITDGDKITTGSTVSGDLRLANDSSEKSDNEMTEAADDEALKLKFPQDQKNIKDVRSDMILLAKAKEESKPPPDAASGEEAEQLNTATERMKNIEKSIREIIDNFGRNLEIDTTPDADIEIDISSHGFTLDLEDSSSERSLEIPLEERATTDYSEPLKSENNAAKVIQEDSTEVLRSSLRNLVSDDNGNVNRAGHDDPLVEKEQPPEIPPRKVKFEKSGEVISQDTCASLPV